ncbi:hypothetical protein [Streptomyces noursei]|uniref:hypothetical protein n=1 Tax=Streptomyces noursei TaxID=1971 RepID=UPI00167294FD|nr:hypothetical protein [Streptomyces noursei]MCZ1019735.1 hypothetical protein [Streptomyces noursei]GGX50942.1 hypothetical protein GCM10010341_85630 [Streptomyces noursei]
MTILRRHLSTGFTVLPTATIEDSRLSFRARGILAFLLAKPDNWKVRSESIAAAGQEGRDAVRKALRELRNYGYYRVVTERLDDGTLVRVTEVHDTAQEWASEEYSRQVGRRVARRLERQMEDAPSDVDGSGEPTGDGFSGVGEPGVGEPAAGSSGFLVSNQNQYTEKNPPTPTAGAAGEPGNAPLAQAEAPPSCPTHPDGLGRSCRSCGTSPRQLKERQQRAEKEQFKARERAANERLLTEVRHKPGGEGLSEVAQQQLAHMREMRRETATRKREVE